MPTAIDLIKAKGGLVVGPGDAPVAECEPSGAEAGKLKQSQLPGPVENGSFTGDATGATDVGPALMKAFEEGSLVRLKRGGKYLINSPVFLDSPVRAYQYVLNATGAEIIYGSGLPSASTLEGLAGTKWAFFSNTLRAALSAGVVTTTAANRATGAAVLAPTPRLIIKGGVHNANGNIIGIAFGNGASTRIEMAILENIQAGISWSGYVDENTMVNCQTVGASPTGGQPSRLIYQRESGDGTSVDNCKAFGGVHLDLSGCYGFRASSCISGQFILNGCAGKIDVAHQETDEINTTPYSIFLNRTKLTLTDSVSYASKKSSGCTIKIEDTAGVSATILDIVKHREAYYFRPSGPTDAADPERGPTVQIVALNSNGQVRMRDSKSRVVDGWGGSGGIQYPEGYYIASSVSGITSALTAGADLIVTGNFDLSYNGVWLVSEPANLTIPARSIIAPALAATADASGLVGALTEGQAYSYVAAGKTADGRYTPLSAEVKATPGGTKANNLTLTNLGTPCTIALWRFTGASGVKTEPDHYIEIPVDGYSTVAFDTGTHINGRAWQTVSLPVPNTVAGAVTVTNTTDPAGTLAVTFDRMGLTDTGVALEAGKAVMVLTRHKGGVVKALNFRTTGTAGKGTIHAWAAIVNLRGEIVAVTAEKTAIAANSNVLWELAEPTNVPPGVYYTVLMHNCSETMPTVIVSSGAGSSLALLPPISTGVSTSTGLTTPPTVGSTLPVPATGTATVPYIWWT
jgi:hypothetical protein